MSHVLLALDLGGTSIKAELVDRSPAIGGDGIPRVISTRRRPTPRGDADVVLDAVVGLAKEVLTELPSGPGHPQVGVAVPGLVDARAGVGRYSANLGWRDAQVAEVLCRELGLPVTVVHDIFAAAVAEHRYGAGRGAEDVAVVVVGTGVAAAFIAAGQPVTGGAGQAGELGHVTVRPGGPMCVCGRQGCLEAVASAGAIARRYGELSGQPVDGALAVQQRLGRDAVADLVWSEAVSALADGLLVVAALLAPQRIVVGGGLAESGDDLMAPLRRIMLERATVETLPELVPAGLGARAGLVGAALAAHDPDALRSAQHLP